MIITEKPIERPLERTIRKILNELDMAEDPFAKTDREPRTTIRQTFNGFAFDPDFQKKYLAETSDGEKSRTLEGLKTLKRIYYENILSNVNFPTIINKYINQYMRDLVSILDTSLDTGKFNERVEEL